MSEDRTKRTIEVTAVIDLDDVDEVIEALRGADNGDKLSYSDPINFNGSDEHTYLTVENTKRILSVADLHLWLTTLRRHLLERLGES